MEAVRPFGPDGFLHMWSNTGLSDTETLLDCRPVHHARAGVF